MFKVKLLTCIIALFLVFVTFDSAMAETVDAAGYWQGNWYSTYGTSGGLYINITQSGTTLGGTLTITGTTCGTFSNLALSGSVSGNVVTAYAAATCQLDVPPSYNELTYTDGVVSGNSMNGNYTVDSDYVLYDWGTFSLTRTINIIRASAGANGNISPSGDVSVNAGSNQIFQINPDTGYRVSDVLVDGASVGAKTSHTFYNLSSNHTISATFELAPAQEGQAGPSVRSLLLDNE